MKLYDLLKLLEPYKEKLNRMSFTLRGSEITKHSGKFGYFI